MNTNAASEVDAELSNGTLMIAAAFQAFLSSLDGNASAGKENADQRQRPGRPARSAEGLASRRLTHPLASLYVAVALAEISFLPQFMAYSAEERDRINVELARIMGLVRFRDAGLITSWTFCWQKGGFPKRPTSVRIHTAGGKGARELVLGELAPQLREWIELWKGLP